MYVTTYSLFGLTWLAFIVAGVSQMAAQDGNYYAAINALQSPAASDLVAAPNASAAAARSASVARRSPRRSASVSSIARIA